MSDDPNERMWHLYGGGDGGSVSVVYGNKGPTLYLGQVGDALALADRIRREFMPPSMVRIREAWPISEDPHATIVLHLQAPHLTAAEVVVLQRVIAAVEDLVAMMGRRLNP